jgi:hypothetical protein
MELDEGSYTAGFTMELLECDLDKQAESGITAAKYALTAEC